MANPEEDDANTLLECHECGLFQTIGDVPSGSSVVCSGCGCHLLTASPQSMERALAFAVAALVCYVIAQSFPFMSFEMRGRLQDSHLVSGALEFFNLGFIELAVVVALSSVVLPGIMIVGQFALLVPITAGWMPRYIPWLMRALQTMRPWAMAEVFVFSVFVAYVKLVDLATLGIGPGCYAFFAMVVFYIAADTNIDPHSVWNRVMKSTRSFLGNESRRDEIAGCGSCGLVCHIPKHTHIAEIDCPRCGTEIVHRKPDSLSRTWALVISAAILYIPANTYPILTVISFGQGSPSTIFGGVVELIEVGMYPIAAIVFLASIFVPMFKLIGIAFLLTTIHFKSTWRPRDRTALYRIIEFIGRWSMIDIFVIAILISLVKLGNIATIDPGPAAIAFAAVVMLTMLASMSFDPRLVWDATKIGREKHGK